MDLTSLTESYYLALLREDFLFLWSSIAARLLYNFVKFKNIIWINYLCFLIIKRISTGDAHFNRILYGMPQTRRPASGNSPDSGIPVPLFALDANDEHVPAYIHSISSEAVQLRTRVRVSPGRQFVMHYEECRKELTVTTCRQGEKGDYYLDCKIETSQNGVVRDDWRMAVKWPAQVEISGTKNAYKAQVRDISAFGLGIQLPFQPELDSLLIVRMKSGVGFGRVRHCRQAARRTYIVGLYLEEFHSKEQNVKKFAHRAADSSQGLGHLLHKIAHCLSGNVTRSV